MAVKRFSSMRPTTLIGGLLLLICGINLRHGIVPPDKKNELNLRQKRDLTQQLFVSPEYHQQNCVTIDPYSIEKFNNWVTKDEAKFISFKMFFTPAVNASQNLFFAYEWIWTYSGMEEAAFSLIKFPFDFDLLSCGLLTQHVKRYRPIGGKVNPHVSVIINVTQDGCLPPLGNNITDLILQQALQELVNNTKYAQNSKFCYEVIYNVTHTMGSVWGYLTHFFGVQRDYTGYRCCPYPKDKSSLGCNVSVKQTDYLWIIQVYGMIIAIFSPLMLQFCPEGPSNMRKHNHRVLPEEEDDLESFVEASEMPMIPDEEWVYLGDDRFTFFGFIKRIWLCNSPSMIVKRIRRVIFIHLSLIVILIRTLLYYFLKMYNVKKRIDRDIPIGHLCIPFGLQDCLKNTWYFLGSPVIYLPLYLLFGSILLCIPEDIPHLFLSSKEFSDESHMPIRTFLYITDGALECRKIIRNHDHLRGYKKLTAKLQDRFSMLITRRFWKLFFKVWSRRFRMLNCVGYCSYAAPRGRCRYILMASAILPTVICWLLLSTLALLELIFIIFYYGCPIVFFLKLQFSGFLAFIFHAFSLSLESTGKYSSLLFTLSGIASVIIFIIQFFVLFVGVFQFVVSFTFLLHVVSFTFVGMVVYPELVLTYVLAALAILYYSIKSVSGISEGFTMLLSLTVKVSKTLADEDWRPPDYHFQDDEYRYSYVKENPDTGMLGVPKEAFDDVIETFRPFRMQIIAAFVKLFITGNIIYSSVSLIQSFHKGQNVSLPARTIAVIFVGFLPEFFGVFQSSFQERVREEKFEKSIQAHMKQFWQNRFQLTTSEAVA